MLENTSNQFKFLSKRSRDEKNPFSNGMYSFVMYMIDYYSRVRKQLKLDYDSFIIVQVVLSHNLYKINKQNTKNTTYNNLNTYWDEMLRKYDDQKNSNIERYMKI